MKQPKKIYLSTDELQTFRHRTEAGKWDAEYISVDHLKEWITENTSTAENQAGEFIIYVDRIELFTFIEDENS